MGEPTSGSRATDGSGDESRATDGSRGGGHPRSPNLHATGPGVVHRSRNNLPALNALQRPRRMPQSRRRQRARVAAAARKQGSNPLRLYQHKLKNETFAGMVLLAGAMIALAWANSPWREVYHAIAGFEIGPAALHLDLSLATWAADGLLAIFFFVIGLELKTEFVTGALRDLRLAAVPMIAAVFGMVGPVAVYAVVQVVTGAYVWDGWAIPVATDIAFAVALLGIFGRGLPPGVRTFLLTLAVVDDLLAIMIIAIFFSEGLNFVALGASLAVIALFGFLAQKRLTHWWVLVPLGVVAWVLMHEAGVHATIAGVLLGMTIPARARYDEPESQTHRIVDLVQPWSAGLVLPVFAFFAAGVSVIDSGGLGSVLADPVAIGVYLGLPLGKLLGIWGGTALIVKTTRLRLGGGIDLPDLLGVALLAGIGFTVSLLIAQLSFGDVPVGDYASVAVIVGSVISAALGGAALRLRAHTRVRGRAASRA